MDFVTSDVIESRMIPTMNENGRLVDIIFGAVKLELRQNAFSFLTKTLLFKFLASFSATYQKIVLHFSSCLINCCCSLAQRDCIGEKICEPFETQ